MELMVNGKKYESVPDISVIQLLDEKQVESPEMVSVEINGKILAREKFDLTRLKENDRVEFLYFMGGG